MKLDPRKSSTFNSPQALNEYKLRYIREHIESKPRPTLGRLTTNSDGNRLINKKGDLSISKLSIPEENSEPAQEIKTSERANKCLMLNR